MDNDTQVPAGTTDGNSATGTSPAAGAATQQPQGQQPPAQAGGATQSAAPSQPAGDGGITGRARTHINRLQRENDRLRAQLAQRPATPPAQSTPAPTVDREATEVQEEFYRLFPQARKFMALDPEQLERLIKEVAPRSEAMHKHYLGNMGRQTLRSIEKVVREEFGDATKEGTVRMYQSYFLDWLDADEERAQRYEENDPELVNEFWKEVTTDVHEPIRSKATETARQQANRVNGLPPFGGRGAGGGMARPAKPATPATPENVHDRAWERLIEQRASGQ